MLRVGRVTSAAPKSEDGTLLARREKKELKNYDAYKTEIDTNLLALSGHNLKPARFRLDEQEKQYTGFSISFLTRMVFSTLVDADWLETERYMQEEAKPRGQHADISTLAEGVAAAAAGADLLSTTMSGYTPYSPQQAGADLELVRSLAASVTIPVLAEGRYRRPEEVAQAVADGAIAVVVGGAITRPQEITRAFVAALMVQN